MNKVAPPCLSLFECSKSYYEAQIEIKIFKELNYSIQSGTFYSLQGKSGVGKSTLLQIMGLLDKPNQGKVFFNGEDISKLSDPDLSRIRSTQIGFVFQFHHLLPDFTALENIQMPAWIAGRKKEVSYAQELLNLVGLSDRANHLPSQLSGGERQRVALARALMNRPKLLLCDEPSGNLDEFHSEKLHTILLDIYKQTSVSLFVVTHDKHLANLAEIQLWMENGTLKQIAN